MTLLPACGDDAKPKVDTAALETSWSAFVRCTVGPPLKDGEKASERMLRAELTQLAAGGTGWPNECTALAEAIVPQLEGAGESYENLRKGLGLLSGTAADMYLSPADDGRIIDRIFAAADGAGLTATEGGDGPVAPALASPATAEQRTELGTSGSVLPRIELTPERHSGRVVYATEEAAFACRFGTDPKVPLKGVDCAEADWEHGVELAPISSEKRDATYLWDDQPKSGIRLLGDDSFYKMPASPTAFAFADETIVDVTKKKRKALLARRLNYGRVEQAQLKGPGGGLFMGHRASVIVWGGPTRRATNKRPLVLQMIKQGRIPVGGEKEVGELHPSIGHPMACRAGERITVMVAGDEPLEGEEHQIAMISRVDGAWRRLATGRAALGEGFEWDARGSHSFVCTEEGGAFTWLRKDGSVGQVNCTEESCRSAVSKPLPTEGKTIAVRVATVGNQVLWLRAMQAKAPMTSVTELVAMRLAPIEKLDTAPVQVLAADEAHGGLSQLTKSLDLIATGPAAVALVRNGDKVVGIRIGADGDLSAP